PRPGSQAVDQTTIIHSVKNDTSPPLRDMPPAPRLPRTREAPENPSLPRALYPKEHPKDTIVQRWFGVLAMPTPIVSFDGIQFSTGGTGWPPDTNGDVGPNHYVQWVNGSIEIWDKSGNRLLGPVFGNTIWQGFGAPCETHNDGDPIALYDSIADRWMISQFTVTPPYY